jgi:hypothetical protein
MNDVIDLPDLTSLGPIGQPLRRKEDERLLTGRGRFSDDFTLPGQTYAAVVRSLSRTEFAADSPLEGDGFEPSVSLWRMAPGPASAELRKVPVGQLRFAPDSPLEETRFEPLVPLFVVTSSARLLSCHLQPALGDAIKSEQVRMTAAIFYAKTKMGWKETVVDEQANKDDKPFLVDDARQRLIDEIDRIRARKEQKGE